MNILLVDDGSTDNTVAVAREMGLTVIVHPENRGYGGNQKTCYKYALDHGADVVVMIHPDYQYDARVIPHAVGIIELGICDVVLGSRVRSRQEALKCGMPWWKYFSNRVPDRRSRTSPWARTWATSTAGSASTAGACSRRSRSSATSDDFVFDTQFLVQAVHFGFRLGDMPVPVRYFDEASSINFRRSTVYGVRTLGTMARFWLHRLRLWQSGLFKKKTS